MKLRSIAFLTLMICNSLAIGQNSLIGDGFGGRSWYTPTNYGVGSYSAFSLCNYTCNDLQNQLYGWGNNQFNRLGIGEPASPVVIYPTPIPNLTDIEYFSAGYMAGAIKKDGTGWVWGVVSPPSGYNGNPLQVISDVAFLDASSRAVCFVKTDGTVWSVGFNVFGGFGNGISNEPFTLVPQQMLNITDAVRVAVIHGSATCILRSDSSLMSVGRNPLHLGLGPTVDSTFVPLPIVGIPAIVDIKACRDGMAALAASGDVYWWGSLTSPYGSAYANVPTRLTSLDSIVAISACDDGTHFLALDESRKVYAWGMNGSRQCGVSDMDYPVILPSAPQLVATDAIDIMAAEHYSYLVKSDSTLWFAGTEQSVKFGLATFPVDSFAVLNSSTISSGCQPNRASTSSPLNKLTVPNVFSPNSDGVNDRFGLVQGALESFKMQVYDRWGTLLFQSNMVEHNWDGKAQSGQECPEGVYFYIMDYTHCDGLPIREQGHVSLLR